MHVAYTTSSERVICRKLQILTYPHLHLAPQLGAIPLEIRRDLWRQKTRPSRGVVCVILNLAVLTLPACDEPTHTTTAHTYLA